MDQSTAGTEVGLRASLFGRVKLAVDGIDIPDKAWARRNSRYLLLLLLSTPGHRLSRDLVMESLWPNASPETATRSLYVAIHGLRRVLEPGMTSGKASRFVDLSGEILQMVPGSLAGLDIDEFEAALRAEGDRRQNLGRALAVYDGDLMVEEPFVDWPVARRERLRSQWREAVLEVAELELQAGRPMHMVPSIERVLEGDPADEVAYRVLMSAFAAADRREDALRVYERCVVALEDELGVEPSADTAALMEAIRDQPVARPVVSPRLRIDNLPAPANPIVGRGRDTEEMLDLVCQPGVQLVTVTGTGGLGKTRTALEVASLARDEFEHGVCFVSLAEVRDPTLVIPAVAHALGLDEVAGKTSRMQLEERLREASMLLVLDNFEQVLDAAPDVAEVLEASSEVTMLVTSRVPLRIRAEHEFPLDPLAVPDVDRPISLGRIERYPSVELFVQRATAARRKFRLTSENAGAIAQVCARLDGLPLAIELAAARIRDLQPDELLEGLADRLDLLSEGYRDMPPRHRTMREAIRWSYDLLSRSEQEAFRLLAVFHGGFEVDAATAVTGGTPELATMARTARLLASLEEQGLLHRDDVAVERRYRMFETIREFAGELLVSAGEYDETAKAHARWYVTFVDEATSALVGPDQNAWFERVGAEVSNLRAASAYLVEDQAAGTDNLRLTAGTWRYWWKCGYPEQGLVMIQRAIDTAADTTSESYARALYAAGGLAESLGRYDYSEEALTAALKIFRRLGEEQGEAEALDSLGILARNRGDLERSESLLEEALAIHSRLGNSRGMASALNGLGAVGYYRGDTESADRFWSAAVATVRKMDDERALISILSNVGALANLRQDHDRALEIGEETLRLARKIGDANGITFALAGIATAQFERGELEEAGKYFEETLVRSRDYGFREMEAVTLFNLANIARRNGDGALAISRQRESLGIFAATSNAHGVASCLEELGGLALERSDDLKAVRLLAVADALRQVKGVARDTVDHGGADYQKKIAMLRERLGEDTFDASWAAASLLETDEVVQAELEHAGNEI